MKPKTWIKCSVIILGVIIIPLLYSYFYLGAFWDPYNRLETVPVAVVNEDEGAEINGETRNLGKEAVKKIIDDGTMKFTETTAADAEAGVNGTKYYAVIKFPKDFSAKIASANETDKEVATVTYSANMKHNYICSQIMKNAVLTIEEQTRDSVSKEITSTLVDKLNEVPSSLNTLDDGLSKLSDGATTLSDGTSKYVDAQKTLTSAFSELKSGTAALYSGSSDLHNGMLTLSSGINAVASGTSELAEGTKQLPALVSGVNQLGDGANLLVAQTKTSGDAKNPTLYDGITQLAGGLTQLNAQFKTSGDTKNPSLWDATYQLSTGLAQLNAQFTTSGNAKNPSLYDASKAVSDGMDTLYDEMFKSSGDASKPSVYDSINDLSDGTSQYVDGTNQTLFMLTMTMIKNDANPSATLTTYNTTLQSLATSGKTDSTTQSAIKQYATLSNLYTAALNSNVIGIYSSDPTTAYTNFVNNLKTATQIDGSTGYTLVTSGAQLTAGTAQLKSAVTAGSDLQKKVVQLKAGANGIYEQFNTGLFKQGVATASAGATQLYNQVNSGTLKSSVEQLKTGASSLESKYTGEYTTGVNQLAGGMNTLVSKATALGKLSDGVDKLNAGATALSSGTEALVDGSATLESKLGLAASSVSQMADGNSQLASAASSINSGAAKLKDGLNTAKSGVEDKITEANDQLKSTDGLADYTENSVNVDEEDINHLPNYGSAFAPYFMSLSLYVGALLIFFGIYLDADDRIKVLSRHSENKIIRVLGFAGIGAAQAIALALICQFALKLAIDNIPAFYGSLILISLVFISIVEFLVVNLKDIGKFLSIAFLVLNLTSNGGTFPMETTPDLFQALYPWMPMTYSVNLLKEITVNFNGSNARYNALVLLGIFVLFTSLTIVFSLTKKAKVKVEELIQQQN